MNWRVSFKWNFISTKSIQFFHQWIATNSSKQPKAQARWVPSKFKIIWCIQLAHHNTFETFGTSQCRSIHSKYINIPIFPHLYRSQDNKLGQRIWDKWSAIGNMLGNTLRTWEPCWRPIENILETNSNNSKLQKIFTKKKTLLWTLSK